MENQSQIALMHCKEGIIKRFLSLKSSSCAEHLSHIAPIYTLMLAEVKASVNGDEGQNAG